MTEPKGILWHVTHQYLRELCEAQMEPMRNAICKEQAEDTSFLVVNTLMSLHLLDGGLLTKCGEHVFYLGYQVITEKYANTLWRIES